MSKKNSPDEEKRPPNPARDLQEFLQELQAYPAGTQNMLRFLSDRYKIESQDQRLVLKRMYADMQLADRAIVATEAALGDRSPKYLQWKDNVLSAFLKLGLESHVDHVRGMIDRPTMMHLDYCVSRLDELELDEELHDLLELIERFRVEAASLNLPKDVVASIHDHLQELEDVAWAHFYRLDHDDGVIGRVMFKVAELGRTIPQKEVVRVLSGIATLAWRVYIWMHASRDLLPEPEWLTRLLPPGDDEGEQ